MSSSAILLRPRRCALHEQTRVKLDAQDRKVFTFPARAMDDVEAFLRRIEHDLIGAAPFVQFDLA